MSGDFAEMDKWVSEDVALFKEEGKNSGKQPQIKTFRKGVQVGPQTLVAEGDSWFDYLPGTDIIDCLRNHHCYVIENYARAGDTLENMIYGTNINRRFERVNRTIDAVLRKIAELKPKVFLFSGGGNDVAGEEFESYLNHNESGLPVLRSQYIDQMINNVFSKYFEDLINKVSTVSGDTHIVAHGYGRTAPTGEGVDFIGISFAGPWLKPALARKGVFDLVKQREAVFALIDEYNEMLKDLSVKYPQRFHYVDLRDMLDPDCDWVNELHLRNSAYARAAKRIHETIQSI
jgi:hypothetical protein